MTGKQLKLNVYCFVLTLIDLRLCRGNHIVLLANIKSSPFMFVNGFYKYLTNIKYLKVPVNLNNHSKRTVCFLWMSKANPRFCADNVINVT